MERKIGEIFTYKGKTYQVVKFTTCIDCAFRKRVCSLLKQYVGQCTSSIRTDKTSVIFKEINNMEIKNNQLTIDIPEGMEIDLENSDLAKNIIRFKDANITLEDIYKDDNTDYAENLIILSENKFFNKLLCIARLIDIANYYNKGWKPNWSNKEENKYYIVFYHNSNENDYAIRHRFEMNHGSIFFKNQEDAQTVIDNPNFRYILDTIYKD